MKPFSKNWIGVVLLIAGLVKPASGQTIIESLKQAKEEKARETAEVLEPVNRRYRETLDRLLQEATRAGDLDTAIIIKQEITGVVVPDATAYAYVPSGSAAPEAAGYKSNPFPTMETNDPNDVFKGKPIYFNLRNGHEVNFSINSRTPLNKMIYRGVAFENFHIEIRDVTGRPIVKTPTLQGGNREQVVEVPLPGITSFTVVVHNESASWILIKGIEFE